MQKLTLTATAVALLGLAAFGAQASTTTFNAASNAYVDAGGYYTPASNASAIEVEGPSDPNDAPKYEAYGLLEFTGTPTGPLSSVTGLTFSAYDDGSKYENKGLIDFYLVGNPGALGSGLSLAPAVTVNPVGVSAASQTALGLTSLGAYNFGGINGYDSPLSVSLTLSGPALSTFETEAAAGNIALLFTADASTPGVGLFLDQYNSKYTTAAPPEALSFTATTADVAAVPEVSAPALLALCLVPLALIARKRRAAR